MTRQQTVLLDGLKIIVQIFWGSSLETCAEMIEDTYLQRFKVLSSVLNEKATEDYQQIASILSSFQDGESLYQYLEDGYVRLFINAGGGIAAPLYQSCYEYEGAPLMGAPATAMIERLGAMGLSTDNEIREPPDHISIELEYLYFLLEKGWNDENKALEAEAAAFASEVMLPWVFELHERVASEKKCRFYPLIASILVQILHVIAGFRM